MSNYNMAAGPIVAVGLTVALVIMRVFFTPQQGDLAALMVLVTGVIPILAIFSAVMLLMGLNTAFWMEFDGHTVRVRSLLGIKTFEWRALQSLLFVQHSSNVNGIPVESFQALVASFEGNGRFNCKVGFEVKRRIIEIVCEHGKWAAIKDHTA